MKFKVAAVLGIGAVRAVAAACSSRPAATTSTQAPQVTVLIMGADNGNGIFLAPQGSGPDGTGPEIVSITGKMLWFRPQASIAASPR